MKLTNAFCRTRSALPLFVMAMLLSTGCQSEKQPASGDATVLLSISRYPNTAPTVEATFDREEFELYKATQIALIQSDYVLRPAVDSQGIRSLSFFRDVEDKVARMREHLTVTSPGDSEILQLHFSGGDPDENQEILQAITNSYLDNAVAAEERDNYAELQYLRHAYVEVTTKCRDLRVTLDELNRAAESAEETETETGAGRTTAQTSHAEAAELRFALELEEATARELKLAIDRLNWQVMQASRVRLLMPPRVTP